MQYEGIRDYYKRLTKDSLENVVGHLWYNILREYFLTRDGFQLEVQSRPAPGVTKQSNSVTIRSVNLIKNGRRTKTLVLLENKSVSLESHTSTWTEAVSQLTGYMKLVRTNSSPEAQAEPMFGIVTGGHYSRFYVLQPKTQTLADYPGTDGKLLEFKEDEMHIVGLLNSIKAQALRPSTAASQSRPASRGGGGESDGGSNGGSNGDGGSGTGSNPASRCAGR